MEWGEIREAQTPRKKVFWRSRCCGVHAEWIVTFEDRKDSREGHPGAVAKLDRTSGLPDVPRDQAMGRFG